MGIPASLISTVYN